MTANLRARARELALEAYWTTPPDAEKSIDAIESALLRFAAEALRAEPDEGMAEAGIAAPILLVHLDSISARKKLDAKTQFRAMAEVRAASLEGK
jgi:hypothetical protein